MDPADNVVTCVEEIKSGEKIIYRNGDEYLSLTAAEDIPYCHKAALIDLRKGEHVIKYGELIGETNALIKKGGWVSHNNIFSVPRDYDSELV